jgi:Protein of unknown function (DUF2281)
MAKSETLKGGIVMVQPVILEKLEQLPEAMQMKVLHYIESLLVRHDQGPKPAKNEPTQDNSEVHLGYGSLEGQIWMSDDFDEPLEDLQDYM